VRQSVVAREQRLGIADIATTLELFRRERRLAYLDTATYGTPPRTTIRALESALTALQSGAGEWEEWEAEAEHARALFARLVRTTAGQIALLPAASAAASLVVSTLDTDAEVVICPDDHPSVTLPVLVWAKRHGLRVRSAAFNDLADTVTANTRLVALSHVHYATGGLSDVASVIEAARQVGAHVYMDATQSAGVLPIDISELGVDYLSCAAYKWLCCPRGVAFLYVAPDRLDELSPLAPSRRTTTNPLTVSTVHGSALATGAARLDSSLAWLPWIGARHSLEAVIAIDDLQVDSPGKSLARLLAEELQLPPPESAICAVPVTDIAGAQAALQDASVKAAARNGAVRISPHFYNTAAEIDQAVQALRPFRASTSASAPGEDPSQPA
jgi:selenocysteine lyase/cysteine desulfurase